MKILRCTPTYYDVIYSINPHMQVGKVLREAALEQWEALGDVYKTLGVDVATIEGQEGLPDMVFSANQSFCFRKADGQKAVIMANMTHPERQGEVPYYTRWFEERGYKVYRLPKHVKFEGMGDVFYHADRSFLWGAYGFRTDLEAHRLIEKIIGVPVRSLRLLDPAFYHLDTCLCVLSDQTALVYPEAFSPEAYRQLQDFFPDLIRVRAEDAFAFACNAHCLDRKHIVLQRGTKGIEEKLRERNFTPVPVETGEFIKAGGSVTCLRLELE